MLEETHYYPFGLPIHNLGTAAAQQKENRLKYQSNEYIEDNDLRWMNFNARQYDPQIGRFLSIDPLAYQYGQQIYSPYAAMGNNPGMMVDPNGTNPGYATIDYRSDELIGPSAHEMWLQGTGNNVSPNIKSTNSNYSINAVDVNSYHYSEAEREYAMAAIQSAILGGISVTEAMNFDYGSIMDMNRCNGVQSVSYDNYYPPTGLIASVNGAGQSLDGSDPVYVSTSRDCGVVVNFLNPFNDEEKSVHKFARKLGKTVKRNTFIVIGHADGENIIDITTGINRRLRGSYGLDLELKDISQEYRVNIANKTPSVVILMGCNTDKIAKMLSKKHNFLTVIGSTGFVCTRGIDENAAKITGIDQKLNSGKNDGHWKVYKNGKEIGTILPDFLNKY